MTGFGTSADDNNLAVLNIAPGQEVKTLVYTFNKLAVVNTSFTFAAPVPEPSLPLLSGLGALLLMRRRRVA